MKKISFIKMSGAGNDFIVIDKGKNSPFVLASDVIKRLCDRRNGIGADGVITIAKGGGTDFEMEYFNADGSTGTLCGNGSRCAVWYAFTAGYCGIDSGFSCGNEDYKGKILSDENVKFYLKPPHSLKRDLQVELKCGVISADFVNTGSPHAVIDICKNKDVLSDDLEQIDIYNLGREIRNHKSFAPDGTNVNFIKISDNKIYIRTYERGVEDETLACGTGSTAAAYIAFLNNNVSLPVSLITRSNEILSVDFSYTNNMAGNISLAGPAKIVFSGIYTL
jgi:diaminopimelate epimerase